METPNKKNKPTDFHAVEYMRKVREEMSAEYEQDPEVYLARVRKTMEDFKKKLRDRRKAA